MYVAQIYMARRTPSDENTVSHAIIDFLATLRMNGQVCGKEWPIAVTETGYTATVLLPEQNALDPRLHNRYVHKFLQELDKAGLEEPTINVAEELEEPKSCECGQTETFILYTRYLSLEPPLRCGNCLQPVPLYRIPPTKHEEYYDIVCWQSDYIACDTLQMNCTTLERAAMRQISRWDSNLSRIGIALCRHIQELTQKPTYYYLYRYGARSRKQELARRCPSCDGEWLLPTPYHIFDFKCDRCLLLSNIAWDVH